MKKTMVPKLIAPCGMNCFICKYYLNDLCSGCRYVNKDAPNTRYKCKIKNCIVIKHNHWKYCSINCKEFPCKKLNQLDKRYKSKYGMSMIENLENITMNGINKFLESQEKRWIKNGKVFCVHDKKYYKIHD
jgi:hypothetical protein